MANYLNTLPTFAIGSYEKIAPSIEQGILSYPSYVYISDTKQLAFIDKNLEIQIIKGVDQVIHVTELPDEGDQDILYIYDDIVYIFTGEEYKPMYSDITNEVLEAFQKLNSKIEALEEVVENMSDASSGLEFDTYDTFPEVGVANQLYIDTSGNAIYRYDENAGQYVALSANEDLIFIELDEDSSNDGNNEDPNDDGTNDDDGNDNNNDDDNNGGNDDDDNDDDDNDDDGNDDDNDVNSGLPTSSSIFFENFTESDQAAVDAMEEDKTTVFTNDNLAEEDTAYGDYLGCYEVVGESGVKTLASPVKIDDEYVAGVVVMHYNEETETWENVPDAEIIDGYVWATFDSFSPVAVYTIHYSPYEIKDDSAKYFYLNGLPGVITESPSSSKKTCITTIYGDTYTMSSTNLVVCGGNYNKPERKLKETNIIMTSGKVLSIVGSSVNVTDTVEEIDTVNVIVNGGTVTQTICASNGRVRVNNANTVINGGTVKNASAGVQSYITGYGNFNSSTPDENSDAITINPTVIVNDGEVEWVYVGGVAGYGYAKKAYGEVNGGKITSGMLASSNGVVDEIEYQVHGGEIALMHSVNRGNIKKAYFEIDGGTIDKLFMGGDATDATVTGTINEASAVIDNSAKVTLYPGTTNGKQITFEDDIIKSVAYLPGTTTFADGFEEEFESVISQI